MIQTFPLRPYPLAIREKLSRLMKMAFPTIYQPGQGVYDLTQTLDFKASRSLGVFTPTDLTGLLIWIDFGDITKLYQDVAKTIPITAGGQTIGAAADKSGNNSDFTQSTSIIRPTYNTNIQNSLGASYYNASRFLYAANGVLTDDNFSAFCVAKGAAQPSGGAVLISQSDNASVGRCAPLVANPTSPYTEFELFFNNGSTRACLSTTAVFNSVAKLLYSTSNGAGTSYVSVNGGAAEGTLTGQTFTPININTSIGRNYPAGQGFLGYIMEVLIYQPSLSGANRILVETYLNAKWALW